MSDEGLWRVEDVAAFLKCSRRTVYSLVGLPRTRVTEGGMIRFDPAEVRAWAESRKTHSFLKERRPIVAAKRRGAA